ncbi:hypothetical protein OS493_000820 [Desmophyllum pertusum]|uniref:RNA-dependent RNA polymerase n=1 Tax=Desmophyllum pertusum TaxID=174260 RepID=A0A9W9ZU40_9CNID|nr:hypothetical protein OS493_000820 [Desmophyllum pertusum]
MAIPYLVPCITPLKCPPGEKLYVKHVILKKDSQKQAKDANTSETRAKDVKNTLIINELFSESKAGRKRVWDKLLMVEFSSLYSEDEIYEILSRGIEFNGFRYSFLGFSASQLRNKTCFLIAAETDKEISDRRTKFGNLSDDIPFADRAATVQHMFEPFERSLQLAQDQFTFEYTPGIPEASGFMSPKLAETIKKKLECSGLAKAPSVVQVICPGLTGGLVLSDEICAKGNENSSQPSSSIKALFKTPVATSDCGNSLTMGIVDCSKPYEVGYLDVYSVMFLEKRGVSRDHLLDLQRQYYELMENLVD